MQKKEKKEKKNSWHIPASFKCLYVSDERNVYCKITTENDWNINHFPTVLTTHLCVIKFVVVAPNNTLIHEKKDSKT